MSRLRFDLPDALWQDRREMGGAFIRSALSLQVTALPHEGFEVGEAVWLEVDPRQMAHLR